ncbi:enolase C-terminal domain-like protein [Jiangella alkaliphila]|uniref:Mannonate dehydratase n=1 Tax=Jiangella alkaliphila TaxID=419479 RepID=A0A1H2LGP6_9ACTN|nr:enolase C-terminal domain-like protein [Jiangella alkaliphila]SDU79751.1 mannonate dehydratase [Jiangella alkaliphila]
MTTITAVRCVRTRADGSWTVVRVETDEPGLYGVGSASDLYNPGAVAAVVEELYAPQLAGRDPADITDIWHTLQASGYWRNGSITATALGAIDVALWDIKGKVAGLPVYQLLGGAARSAVPCYAHASGDDVDALIDDVARYVEDGWTVIRCQTGGYGGGGFVDGGRVALPRNAWTQRPFDEDAYLRSTPAMFERLRDRFGPELKFNHDVHEHLSPNAAVELSRRLDPYRLYYLEDALPPEQSAWYRTLRQHSTTPQAIGELFTHPDDWRYLITERLVDFVRARVSKVGGITGALRIAALAEAFGVRTAWQEGGDNDPLNFAAALHLDRALPNFGIQEENTFAPAELEAFPGAPVVEHGYVYLSDAPGLGVDVDEARAAALLGGGGTAGYHRPYHIDRLADGTVVRP